MQEKEIFCVQCQKPSSLPFNRLVQDACGHKKCRACLLEDVVNCKQCLASYENTLLNENEGNSINNTANMPVITDNHTAVIHCNGQAKCNTDNLVGDNTEGNITPFLENHLESNNKTDLTNEFLAREKIKEKTLLKKKTIFFPDHITVKTDPVCYLCTMCNKSFLTKGHIKYHKYCAGELKPYKCEICSKEFILKVQYQIHMYKHSNVKPFKCTQCPKAFREKSKLSRHMLLHTAGKNYICPECAKPFKTKESLRIHSLIHREEKPFACKTCSAKFSNSSNLKKHLTTHLNEKVHMCDQCGRRFKQKWALSVHRKSHLNERPHTCEVCSKSFVYLKDLQRHIRIHSDTKEFSCSICMTSFRRKDNFHRHMKNTHPGKKGDIIKNPVKVSEIPKKLKVIDNPNAVNVITASPAITKCKTDLEKVPLQPTAISTHSRPTGSVINGPFKLAFKTPAFKSNYNIARSGEHVSSAQATKSLPLSSSIDKALSSSLSHQNTSSVNMENNNCQTAELTSSQNASKTILGTPVPPSPQHDLSSYSSVLHYETSFQNRKHAMIKNIKFKVPEQYTNSFKSSTTNAINNNNNVVSTSSDSQTGSVINTSVIVNSVNLINPSDVHWRRRTSQNLVLKD